MPMSKSSFTDGKPRIATEEECGGPWRALKNGKGFYCSLCGHRFKVGDQWRWQYTNDVPGAGGNPMVCEKCDGTKDEIVAKWKEMLRIAAIVGMRGAE